MDVTYRRICRNTLMEAVMKDEKPQPRVIVPASGPNRRARRRRKFKPNMQGEPILRDSRSEKHDGFKRITHGG